MTPPALTIRAGAPTVGEYKRLTDAVGWEGRSASFIRGALAGSLHVVCAYQGDDMIGMARVSGDRRAYYFIQDVVVLPVHQRRGIGSKLMSALTAWLDGHAPDDATISLKADEGTERFYAQFGFATARGREMIRPVRASRSADTQ